jgi:hypothetical protein
LVHDSPAAQCAVTAEEHVACAEPSERKVANSEVLAGVGVGRKLRAVRALLPVICLCTQQLDSLSRPDGWLDRFYITELRCSSISLLPNSLAISRRWCRVPTPDYLRERVDDASFLVATTGHLGL